VRTAKSKFLNRLLLFMVFVICVLVVTVVVLSRRRAELPEPVSPTPEQPAEMETGTRAIVLYFGSADGSELVEISREMPVPSDPSALLAGVMRELASGPSDKGVAVLPAGAQVRSAYISGNNAYVDFSSELRTGFGGGSTQEYLLISSIVRTVSENFRDISHVQILVEGSTVESLGGHYEITEPLSVSEWE
jgi:spore germination protein GerM